MRDRRKRAPNILSRFGLADTKECAREASTDSSDSDSAALAEEIGAAALALANRANGAGLTALGYLLECVALEAGAQAVARGWPSDSADR